MPAAKYWVTKRCAPLAVEAAECLGGNGYVEELGMPGWCASRR
ncbi:acyl-CoA dehydrogenase family protein [Streptomyces violaceorubidus]